MDLVWLAGIAELLGVEDLRDVGLIQLLGCF